MLFYFISHVPRTWWIGAAPVPASFRYLCAVFVFLLINSFGLFGLVRCAGSIGMFYDPGLSAVRRLFVRMSRNVVGLGIGLFLDVEM